ncbi:MAG: hypothetical protein F6K03_14660, partial [Kamptonema sp. SIO4C4]|nr:hypothetical protein [Kamptonema sp. SIO4C4]
LPYSRVITGAIAVESQATEFGEILDSVLQIATNVKTEMRKLQGRD